MHGKRRAVDRSAHMADGLALIAVLWLISLLTVLATAMLAITRAHERMASRSGQNIVAEAAADSAIRLTLLRINAPINEGEELAFSTQWRTRLLDREVDVWIEREAGRIDLNAADPVLLAAVLSAGGLDAGQARVFAARIVDWRDADDQSQPDGAERSHYAHANLNYAPRNAPFESIGELRHVIGLADLSADVLDAFTVYSTRSPTIAPKLAHPLVRKALQTLPGFDDGPAVNQILLGQVVRVRACVDDTAATLCRVAIARLAASTQKPFLIYAWHTQM